MASGRIGGALDLAVVLDFVDLGHDLIIAANTSASDLIKSVATECGVDFDEDPFAMVIDHKSYAVVETEGDHTLIAADDFIESDVIFGERKIEIKQAPVLFKGIAHSLNSAKSLVRSRSNESWFISLLMRLDENLFKGKAKGLINFSFKERGTKMQ
ncbi:unnamed protein product [Dovyalis caffra]|uniref:Dolichyl-diphosphooligosaccharide--protein glycosyltransferase 48 kDa subunit n=1 Tax=Dovyalis caffra TaxID=77055 RepID=A0AAV1SBA5_9ROSI|nr:unnamed protein product [Dovyalis caffra]